MPTPPSADGSHALAAALEGYSDVYLNCRGIQHRWTISEDLHVVEQLEGGTLVARLMDCDNCGTSRKDRFLLHMDRWQVNRLEVLGASYKYPDDYLMSEMGMTEHPREILRHEQLRRVLGPRGLAMAKKKQQQKAQQDQ